MNKNKDLSAIILSAALISRIQRKYSIKYEFYEKISILMGEARNKMTGFDISSLHFLSQVFRNLDLNYVQKDFIEFNQAIIDQIIKLNPDIKFLMKYVEFLYNLPKEILLLVKKDITMLINKIDSEKLYTVEKDYRNYNFNILILMSKADFLNQSIFSNIFENFYDKISPIKKNFLEELMNLIKKLPEKEKKDNLNKVKIIF